MVNSRSKGRRRELEAAAIFRSFGMDAELMYGQEELGGGRGDLKTTVGQVEVKGRAIFPAWLRTLPGVAFSAIKEDRRPWQAVVPLATYVGQLAAILGGSKTMERQHEVINTLAEREVKHLDMMELFTEGHVGLHELREYCRDARAVAKKESPHLYEGRE